jgi:hypothetical protein
MILNVVVDELIFVILVYLLSITRPHGDMKLN